MWRKGGRFCSCCFIAFPLLSSPFLFFPLLSSPSLLFAFIFIYKSTKRKRQKETKQRKRQAKQSTGKSRKRGKAKQWRRSKALKRERERGILQKFRVEDTKRGMSTPFLATSKMRPIVFFDIIIITYQWIVFPHHLHIQQLRSLCLENFLFDWDPRIWFWGVFFVRRTLS